MTNYQVGSVLKGNQVKLPWILKNLNFNPISNLSKMQKTDLKNVPSLMKKQNVTTHHKLNYACSQYLLFDFWLKIDIL